MTQTTRHKHRNRRGGEKNKNCADGEMHRKKRKEEEKNQFSALRPGPWRVITSVSNRSTALGLPVGGINHCWGREGKVTASEEQKQRGGGNK